MISILFLARRAARDAARNVARRVLRDEITGLRAEVDEARALAMRRGVARDEAIDRLRAACEALADAEQKILCLSSDVSRAALERDTVREALAHRVVEGVAAERDRWAARCEQLASEVQQRMGADMFERGHVAVTVLRKLAGELRS